MKLSHFSLTMLAGGLLMSAPTAKAEGTSPFTTSGSVAFTSDYLYRGVSQSSNTAAVQGSVSLSHESGFYFTVWGSSIDFANGLELDPSIGFAGKAGDVGYDVGVLHYGYPGATGQDLPFTEVYGSVGYEGGKLGMAYSDNFFAKSGKSLYTYVSYGTEISGIGLSASVGLNKFDKDTMDAYDGYVDYKLAASKELAGLNVELAYMGSNLSKTECAGFSGEEGRCDGRAVVTLSKSF